MIEKQTTTNINAWALLQVIKFRLSWDEIGLSYIVLSSPVFSNVQPYWEPLFCLNVLWRLSNAIFYSSLPHRVYVR